MPQKRLYIPLIPILSEILYSMEHDTTHTPGTAYGGG